MIYKHYSYMHKGALRDILIEADAHDEYEGVESLIYADHTELTFHGDVEIYTVGARHVLPDVLEAS